MIFIEWCKKWIWEFIIKKMCVNILEGLIVIVLMINTYSFSVEKNNTGAIIFAGFTLFFILFFWSTKFEIVELLGAKFKLKELNNSINELKDLSKTMAKISLDTIKSKSRMGYGNKQKEQEFFNEINTILDNVNIPKSEKNEIFNTCWHSWNIWDYFSRISGLIRKNLTGKDEKWYEFDGLFREKSEHKYPENHTPIFLKEMLSWAKENSNEQYDWTNIERYIDDFDYYIKNKEFKNFDRWKNLFDQ